MSDIDLMNEIDELREIKETIEELLFAVDNIIDTLAAKQYQLELDM